MSALCNLSLFNGIDREEKDMVVLALKLKRVLALANTKLVGDAFAIILCSEEFGLFEDIFLTFFIMN